MAVSNKREQSLKKTVTPPKPAKKGVKVFPKDVVEVTYTAKSKFHKAGDKSEVHPVQAKKLYDKGFIKAWEGMNDTEETAKTDFRNEDV